MEWKQVRYYESDSKYAKTKETIKESKKEVSMCRRIRTQSMLERNL